MNTKVLVLGVVLLLLVLFISGEGEQARPDELLVNTSEALVAKTDNSFTQPDATTTPVPEGDTYPVVAVVDGDTIDVSIDGVTKRVRYIGINTPETVHPTRGVECYGVEASARNKALVTGQRVRLEKDISETDKYGRLLRYVYVGDMFINESLVADGYANVSTYPPDVTYTETFLAAERAAKAAGRGLWGAGCESYEGSGADSSTVDSDAASGGACTIKGNISTDDGERIYHTSRCPYYNKTVITEAKGERWFCSEEEALAAGWRKALNCN